MQRRQVLKGVAAASVPLTLAGPASAGKPCKLNWRKKLSSNIPDGGQLVVNVEQEVVNDVDSGNNGHWAYDDYRRHIQMWEVDAGEHVAVVQYNGHFDAIEGKTEPGEGYDGTLDGDEEGVMLGGYAASLAGSFLDDPNWPTRGFVGTTDYEGEPDGDIPGYISWQDQYLDDPGFSYQWWGWIYRGGKYGTWVNAANKDCGNIS